MATKEQIREFQDRLQVAFSHNDVVGGRFLAETIRQEAEVGAAFVEKYHGHRVLTDSFLEFFGETLTPSFIRIVKLVGRRGSLIILRL